MSENIDRWFFLFIVIIASLFFIVHSCMGEKNTHNYGIDAVNIDQQHVIIGCRIGEKKVRLFLLDDLPLLAETECEDVMADVRNKTLEKTVRNKLAADK